MNVLKASASTASLGHARVLLTSAAPPSQEPPREAGRWITDAELRRLTAQAYEQGHMVGLGEGRQQALADAQEEAQLQSRRALEVEVQRLQHQLAQEQADRWQSLSRTLEEQLRILRGQLQTEVTEWTFIAICRLLGPQTPDHVAASVRQVLADAQLDTPLTVLLHPQDLPAMDLRTGPWPAGVQLASDDRVALGGCIVQAGHQSLDARLEVQLALLREALDEARRQRQRQRKET